MQTKYCEELHDIRILSKIAEIVKQRRKFEFRLKRPSPLKKDYLAYIDYEKQLDTLRRLRQKSLMRKTGAERSEETISDHAGVARIINIYRLATTRFKGDLKLWFQYLEFCKERRHGRMRKVLAEFLRFHPKEPAAWIYSAAWNFDTNLNVIAARKLMFKGMRACPNSEDLYIEFLRMELTFLNKLRARKVLLGELVGDQSLVHKSADEEKWKNENKELFVALNEGGDGNDERDSTQDGKPKGKKDEWKSCLDMVQTTYSHAIEALPAAFSLRTRFLDIVEAVGLGHLEDMQTKILSDMRRDFSKEPSYWDWLARYEAGDLERADQKRLGKAVRVYEEALEFVPSATIIELYVKFLMDAINDENKDGEAEVRFDSDSQALGIVSHLQTVYEKAKNMGFLTEDLACLHVSFLFHMGKSSEAKMESEKLCSGQFSHSAKLWTLRLSIEMKGTQAESLHQTKSDLQYIFELLRNILMKVHFREAENLWVMV
ncbi:U3 small nucleolar RNA-associated protein-like protein [Striga asiatica]|uniref:U3 small nucleolar RNA-associated protein-like protein n=1 Tax=Striga asiatica TaxID=4170 RepID=A0A5A7R681_STRAF|nr:U3 small nucleolar RNA-associated protein-like protein [Striga asiatica]